MRKIDLENERKFENEKAVGDGARSGQSKFYWATRLEIEEHEEKVFRNIKSKVVLEIGCSSGKDAVSYCEFTAQYMGIDISDEAINNCQARDLKNAKFICTDGHKIPAEDKAFDVVIVNSLLHHLDLEMVFNEISRVLRDDGKLLFREPLGTNPIFQLYRFMTPDARTLDERPFTIKDLKLMETYFDLENVDWFGFSTIISAFVKVPALRAGLSRIDAMLSKGPLKYFYWQFAGVARKK